MGIMIGSCHFVKCKNDNDGKYLKGINKEDGILVICQEFEFDSY